MNKLVITKPVNWKESLIDQADSIDRKVSELSGASLAETVFASKYNPMTFYSNLIELGLKPREAIEVARYYEEMFYDPLMDLIAYTDKTLIS